MRTDRRVAGRDRPDYRIGPLHLLRVSLLRVLESNFPGDPLSKFTDMRIPTP